MQELFCFNLTCRLQSDPRRRAGQPQHQRLAAFNSKTPLGKLVDTNTLSDQALPLTAAGLLLILDNQLR